MGLGKLKGSHGEDAKNKKPTVETCRVPGVNNLRTHGRWVFAEFSEVFQIEKFMSTRAGPVALPDLKKGQATQTLERKDPGWLVICWNDPVNLMTFVTHVFMKVFGWPRPKAEFHMLQVHREGKSVLKHETMERAEFYVHQLQGYGLHATMERAPE